VPFGFDITPMMTAGPNTITLRVEDPPTDRYIPRGKQYWEPKSRGIFYTRTTGIWQPVWLEATGDSYVERVRMTPIMDGTLRIDARIANPADGTTLTARILDGSNRSGHRHRAGARTARHNPDRCAAPEAMVGEQSEPVRRRVRVWRKAAARWTA
jgi:hypothetical protein